MKKCLWAIMSALISLLSVSCGSQGNSVDAELADVATDGITGDAAGDVFVDSLSDGNAGDIEPELRVDIPLDQSSQDDGFHSDPGDDTDLADGENDVVSGDADASDSGDAADSIEPGTFGWPCTDGADCNSGICIQTDDGHICTEICTGDCPSGFSCEVYSVGGIDPRLVCQPDFLNMCRPCRQDTDCARGLASTAGMRCRFFGEEAGSFCVPPCIDHCPDAYECAPSGDGDGKSWCMPVSGACGCTALSIEEGASSSCSVGTAGIPTRCAGSRTCGIDGLTDCSALVPDGEKCNNADDDCDGLTDEPGAIDCASYYFDLDDDGFGVESAARCLCAESGTYRAAASGDCDDANPVVNPDAGEECNGIDDDCDGLTDEPGSVRCRVFHADVDGDGLGSDVDFQCLCSATPEYPETDGGDCDDSTVLVGPWADDTCNGIDDDCNGTTDPVDAPGCLVFYLDSDRDSYGSGTQSKCLCSPAAPWDSTKVGDCDDTTALVNPGVPESCNGIDDNCDGVRDGENSSGCSRFFADRDADGVGISWDSRCLCRKADVFTAVLTGDCDDASASVKPGAAEVCNNDIDEDCDGLLNEVGAQGCLYFFADLDQDGWGNSTDSICVCAATFPYTASAGGDCSDVKGSVYPGATETCGNAIDDDCDGLTDEAGCSGCTVFYLDVDQDGFGVGTVSQCLSAADPVSHMTALVGGDCNDSNEFVFPGSLERCNGLDDDCDGTTDPDQSASCIVFYFDYDGDGYGVSSRSRCLCAPSGDYTATDDGDCDDSNPRVGGGNETCNGVDDDCDGQIDEENASGCLEYYIDDDGDGFGVSTVSRCLCAAEGRFSTRTSGDCDDSRVSVRPGAAEMCNGVDDNCDGTTDPESSLGCVQWYRDQDGDGFGSATQGKCLCQSGNGYVTRQAGDCDDLSRLVSPAAVESCNDVDDNCDGQTDNPGVVGCVPHYADRDGDGWGNSRDSQCLCEPLAPWLVTVGGDCNDASAVSGPGGTEVCNGLDDDCDGLTDEYGARDCVTYFLDSDRDGYGAPGSELCSCAAEGFRDSVAGGDCDDANASVNPGKPEVCNGVDDNCDGQKDSVNSSGCVDYMIDRDSDGFGVAGESRCYCAPTYPWTALIGGDCDDAQALARPGRVEECNGFDDNCDGVTDPENAQGCLSYYRDVDGDGYSVPGQYRCLCAPESPWVELDPDGDCDDTRADVNRGAVEVCDGVDNDCDGYSDEQNAQGCLTRYIDSDRDGFGVAGQSVCRCQITAPYDATKVGDCNDARADIAPGKVEVCNGFDDNCDGTNDPENTTGCTTFYIDQDADGHGSVEAWRCLCAPDGAYRVTTSDDCDDDDARRFPGNEEICFNGVDDDCSGEQDEEGSKNCQWLYKDADGDGYGDETSKRCLCGAVDQWRVTTGGDCCDADRAVKPYNTAWQNKISKCNTWDYDCDGKIQYRYNDDGGGCGGWGVLSGCDADPGWVGSRAGCGETKEYVTGGCGHCGFLWLNCCSADKENRVQDCY